MNVNTPAGMIALSLSSASAVLEHIVSSLYCVNGHIESQLPVQDATEFVPGSTVIVCTYMRAESLDRFLDLLLLQTHQPECLIIVDASADNSTEQLIKQRLTTDAHAIRQIRYFRVAGPLKGLTRQRNYALRWVQTDRVIFFDDDIVLLPDCLEQMERAYLSDSDHLVGVGALIENAKQSRAEVFMSHLNLWLRIVTDLHPGRYYRSGMVTGWARLPRTEEILMVDWLPGCVTLWNTDVARTVGYYEGFDGYGLGEDLDFSLRASRRGKLAIACGARVLHLHASSGRPDYAKLGYMEIYNRYQIHRRNVPERTWLDIVWFVYAWSLDTLFLMRHLPRGRRWRAAVSQALGRCKAGFDLVFKG